MQSLGDLQPYPMRIFLSSNRQYIGELTQLLHDAYFAPTLAIEKVTMTAGDREATFERLVLPNLPPIYLILLENPKVGPRRVKSVFDLVAYNKGAPAIIYVHDSAISTFKLAVLHNFPIVLFHNDVDFKAYFASKILGADDKEVLFVLTQKQEYVMKQIVFREDFAHMKEQKSNKRIKEVKSHKAKAERINVERNIEEVVVTKPITVVTRIEKRTEQKLVQAKAEPLESPPQLKDAIASSPTPKKLAGFVEVARKNIGQPIAVENHKATSVTTKSIPMSREPVARKPWTLPCDVQSPTSSIDTPALFDKL